MDDMGRFAQPFDFPGGKETGVLVIHGYTGTTSGVLPWAEGLAKAGYTVIGPRLTGHGTTWEDLNRISWKDWTRDVEAAYQDLKKRVHRVFVAGLSMGGALAVWLAEEHPEIAGILVVNNLLTTGSPLVPFLPLIRKIVPSVPALAGDIKDPTKKEIAYAVNPTGGSDEWRKLLKCISPRLRTIHQPTLVMKSREDHIIPASSALKLFRCISSQRKKLLWLENSYHVATLDYDLPVIVEESIRFIQDIGLVPSGSD